jgi:hypothetical protein
MKINWHKITGTCLRLLASEDDGPCFIVKDMKLQLHSHMNARQMEVSLCLPGIENCSHMLKLCIVCLGVGVNVFVNVVVQMVERVVVGYLEKGKAKKIL